MEQIVIHLLHIRPNQLIHECKIVTPVENVYGMELRELLYQPDGGLRRCRLRPRRPRDTFLHGQFFLFHHMAHSVPKLVCPPRWSRFRLR